MGKACNGKKKGRPSLLDLQRRILTQQKQREERENHGNKRNPAANYSRCGLSSLPIRQLSRRNSNRAGSLLAESRESISEDDGAESAAKKFRQLLPLPSRQFDPPNSGSLESGSNSEGDSFSPNPKRHELSAVVGRSASGKSGKNEDRITGRGAIYGGTRLDFSPSETLPDKKLLHFILDRLQKKDVYGVFSEPVDPDELPDYHDVIRNPMDFGTVRDELERGAYCSLEEFEKDVFLICSNAMEYNAPDTVYFRQARSMHELAKKSFENLRQDGDEERRPRRGRPPNKKPTMDVPAVETGKCRWPNQVKKQAAALNERRRDTYIHHFSSFSSSSSSSSSGGDRKQLLPVGLHHEFRYAQSLSRFAFGLGTTAWGVASKKIEMSLPVGTPFGRGWVGENEAPSLLPPLSPPPPLHCPAPVDESPRPDSNKAAMKRLEYPCRRPHLNAALTFPRQSSSDIKHPDLALQL